MAASAIRLSSGLRRPIRAISLVIALSAAGLACGSGGQQGEELSWTPCGEPADDLECATLIVPRRHVDDDGRTVALAITRSIAPDSTHREGTLYVHAGGPGIPHVGVVASIRRLLGRGLDRWDVVALDTRGTPGSHDFDCGLDIRQAITGALACSTDVEFDSSWSTADSVADLESLRKTVGSKRARFLGWSYGATLGAAWVETYPESLERVVLDAPGSPWLPWSDQLQARFGAMNQLIPQVLDDQALSTDGEIGVALEMALYDPALWADFRLANAGDAQRRKALVDRRLGISSNGDTGGIAAQVAVRCSDLSQDELARVLDVSTSRSHGIGLAIESACTTLDLSRYQGVAAISGAAQVPVLVFGTRGDVASPMSVVEAVAEIFGERVVVVEGSHHTSVGFDMVATNQAISFLAE